MAQIKVVKISCNDNLPDGYATTIEDAQFIVGEMLGWDEDFLEICTPYVIRFEVVEMDEDKFNALEPYDEVI